MQNELDTNQKRPRQFAAEILKQRKLETRREMLDKVPEHLRAMVRTHVTNAFGRRTGEG